VRITILFILLFIGHKGICQYTRTHNVRIDTFQNGTVFHYNTTKKVKSKEFQLHEFYLKEIVQHTFYYPNGNKSYMSQRITKKGTYGKYCFEIKFEQKEFHENGILKSKELNLCDCYKVKKYNYNEKGKLISNEYIKNRWLKKKMD